MDRDRKGTLSIADLRFARTSFKMELSDDQVEDMMREAEKEKKVECPFAKLGGPNPHGMSMGNVVVGKKVNESKLNKNNDDRHVTKQHKDGDRCPWPFVFFHDPKTGMLDWQTWLVSGLLLCWVWNYFVVVH